MLLLHVVGNEQGNINHDMSPLWFEINFLCTIWVNQWAMSNGVIISCQTNLSNATDKYCHTPFFDKNPQSREAPTVQ